MNKVIKLALMLGTTAAVLAAPTFAGEAVRIYNCPEPSTLALLASGLGGVIALRHWRKG
jgi:PEP-CTERM motif-containing protein